MKISNLNILAISDFCINQEMFRKAFMKFVSSGANINFIEWKLRDLDDMREKILKVEREGPESIPLSNEINNYIFESNVLITHIAPIGRNIIERAGNLKVIGCARSWYENVDIGTATKRKIPLLYCPLSRISVAADFTIGMIISECRSIARAHLNMKQGKWEAKFAYFNNMVGLTGSTVGIIGFGNVGREVAKRLKGYDVKLLVNDPFQSAQKVKECGGQLVELNKLLTDSDFVVLLARLNESTKNMMGGKEFDLMKPTAYFINTARAGLVDYTELRKALFSKRIAGAALDVFDVEPIDKNDPLLHMENVTLTPHIAGVSREAYYRAASDLADDIERFVSGSNPKFIANPEVLSCGTL